METEKEMIENKENVIENENEKVKKEDEEISTTTADNENKSQSANEVLPVIKNIELFVKKKMDCAPQVKPLIEKLLNEDEAASDNENVNNFRDFKNELLKNVIIMTKNECMEMEKKCDEEIFGEIDHFLNFMKQPQFFDCFSSDCFFYKQRENAKKIQEWLNNENILKSIELEKAEKNDSFEDLLSLDDKYSKMIEINLKRIEEMKDSLLNLSLNLRRERENFDGFPESFCMEEKCKENLTGKPEPTSQKESDLMQEHTLQTDKIHILNSEERIVSRSNNFIKITSKLFFYDELT